MRRFRRGARAPAPLVDLSAMIDMVFLLLIFFVVTTRFSRDTGVRVERPQSARAAAVAAQVVPVGITADGAVHVAGREVRAPGAATDGAGVTAAIAEALRAARTRDVLVQADRRAPVGLALMVRDRALDAGAARVDIAAVRP